MNGFLFVDKKEDYTSQDVDNIVKRRLDTRKIGHLGTLDPFATGLLILGVNEGTKFLPYLDSSFKTYEAKLKLGALTDTLDKTGAVLQKESVPFLSTIEIKSALKKFLGKGKQVTPLYSAKHINGVKAYKLARDGLSFTPPSITIDVKRIELISYKDETISFVVEVSKGTYIRALARDIASALNTIGTLVSLRRVQIGAYKPEIDFLNVCKEDVKKIEDVIPYPQVRIDERQRRRLENGNPLSLDTDAERVWLFSNEKLLALYERRGREYVSLCGLKREEN